MELLLRELEMGGAPRSDLESPGDLCAPPHRFGVASVRRFGMGSITVNVRPGVEGGTGRAANDSASQHEALYR